jgi:preprotein translocase subunit YajC
MNPAMTQTLFLGAMMIIFYFFMIRPRQKQQSEQDNFLGNIAKGDLVGTASGIIGKISHIDGGIVTLEVDKGTFIKVTKPSISREVTESLKKAQA